MPTDSSPSVSTADANGIAQAAHWLNSRLNGGELPPLVAVIGLGAGHLLDVLELVAPTTRVLAIEPEPARAAEFRGRRDWRRWFDSGQLTYLVGPEYAGADEAWRAFPTDPDRHVVLVNPALSRADSRAAVAAAHVLKTIVFGARANATARRKFAPRYLANALANLPGIAGGADVRTLEGAYRGVPALIVGAGPSLDEVRDQLPPLTSRALMIATDTALRPLVALGIAPPLVVGVDPGEKNARHFRGLPALPDTWLVAESALDPDSVRTFDARTFWFRLSNHDPWPWYQSIGVEVGHLAIWGSVLTAAFQTAVLAGCDPIVFVGADLAYTGGRPYARGTTYEFDWAYSCGTGETLDRAWHTQMSMCDRAVAPGLDGLDVETTAPLLAFRDWMVTQAGRCGRRVINATGGGILAGGVIEIVPLGDALPDERVLPSPASLTRRPTTAATSEALARHCEGVRAALAAGPHTDGRLRAWAEFTGGALSPSAIDAVLLRAIEELSDPSRAASSPVDDGDRAGIETAAASLLLSLPESTARLRAWRAGDVVSGPALNDPVAALIRAFRLMRPAVTALTASARSATLADVVPAPASLAPTASSSFALAGTRPLPEALVWSVRLIEAWLGAACPADSRRADGSSAVGESFFTRPVLPRASDDEPIATGRGPDSGVGNEAVGMADGALQIIDEWLSVVSHYARNCADAGSADDGVDPSRVESRLRAAAAERLRVVMHSTAAAIRAGADLDASSRASALVLAVGDDPSARMELPIWSAAMLARVATGLLDVRSRPVERPSSTHASQPDAPSIHIALRTGRTVGTLMTVGGRRGTRVALTPRVLTDEGVPRAMPAWTSPDGVVCAGLHTHDTFIVTANGRVVPHLRWPRPICAALPWGDRGAIAWNNGTAEWPVVGEGSVMLHIGSDTEAVVQELTVRPTSGVWWNETMYWSTFPAGFASWRPYEPAVVIAREIALLSPVVNEDRLVIAGVTRGADGSTTRRRSSDEWLWSPAQGWTSRPVGVDGPSTCRATDTGWVATARHEIDAIHIQGPGGIDGMLTCYMANRVAWAGASLLVGTMHGELLLFANLKDCCR